MYDLYIMLIPGIAAYVIFHYLPLYGVAMAFQDFNLFKGVWGSPWIGLEVFRDVFREKSFWIAFVSTLRLNLLLLATFPVPIVFALFLNEINSVLFKKSVQSISYLPHFVSWVIVYGLVLNFFSPDTGLVNVMLKGAGGRQVAFLTTRAWWLFVYVCSHLWKEVGWSAIIYLAALSAIDPQLYEAARIDGAGRFKCMWHVTLPGIKQTVVILLILRIGQMMSIGFEAPYLFGNALVSDVSSVISTYIYQIGIVNAKYSFTTAVGLFQAVINFLLLLVADFAARLSGTDGILWRATN
jgi:putative aldouronate transport system permease protein